MCIYYESEGVCKILGVRKNVPVRGYVDDVEVSEFFTTAVKQVNLTRKPKSFIKTQNDVVTNGGMCDVTINQL